MEFCLNCSFLLSPAAAEALAKVKDQNMSDAFRNLFLSNGQPPLPGLFTRRVDLAAILDAVAAKGISEFYGGNLTQEMTATVRKHKFLATSSMIILVMETASPLG